MRHYTTIALASLTLSFFLACESSPLYQPIPTNGVTMIHEGEEEGNREKRLKWMEMMHRAAPNTSWRQLEYQNQLERSAQRAEIDLRSDCNAVSIAGGQLVGSWKERGSINQAGSVLDTEYDPIDDKIWLISAGGTLWRGNRDGTDWTVINQEFIFSEGLLAIVQNRSNPRILALIDKVPHYSDDQGQSWTASRGTPPRGDYWSGAENVVILDGPVPTVFLLGKSSFWDKIGLYVSSDAGVSFQKIQSFDTHLFEKIRLTNPHHSTSVFLIENAGERARFSEYTPHTGVFTPIEMEGSVSFGQVRVNLTGWASGDSLRLYSYRRNQNEELGIFLSTDKARTWTFQGKLPKKPWEVGIYVSPNNPEVLLMGEVECYRSLNAGVQWTRINRWADYYNDIEHKLHADLMHFEEFNQLDGSSFLLISHHGGLSISYDDLETQQNIGLSGLNVSQYYSVVTDPIDPNFVYAGSQDQGFQRSVTFEDELVESEVFEQVISGDYGHLTFSKEGQSLWAVYPDGWISYYADPQNSTYNSSYQLEEGNRSGLWLPPIMPGPDPAEDAVYMAGGNLSGDDGSYLIKLYIEGNRILAEEGNFNFKAESGEGEISALASAPGNPDYWYVATSNGRFFYSRDAGETWTQSLNFIINGHFFYGQAIFVSPSDENTVYLAGSGYSNPAVFVSKDGGKNFAALHHGLPPTLVLGLAADPSEKYLFAATEAGPYVYIMDEHRWFDLSGNCAPAQTYWSVEYVASLHTARFGTYGRGIWDLGLDPTIVATKDNKTGPLGFDIDIYPNPASQWVTLEARSISTKPSLLRIFGSNGQLLRQEVLVEDKTTIELSQLPAGIYWLQVEQNGQRQSKRLVKAH